MITGNEPFDNFKRRDFMKLGKVIHEVFNGAIKWHVEESSHRTGRNEGIFIEGVIFEGLLALLGLDLAKNQEPFTPHLICRFIEQHFPHDGNSLPDPLFSHEV